MAMTSVVRTAEGIRQAGLPHRRNWLFFLAAAVVIVGIAAAVLWFSPPMVTNAAECTEVTSSQCRPFLNALYLSLGERGGDVASVRGRPWCGEDACQPVFGASLLRLRVTYHDGTTDEYLCSAGALDDPVCELAAPDP
jgi:hypothetical protein